MFKKIVQDFFERVGLVINGKEDCDPQIINKRFYKRVALRGSLGLGESYMDGDWEVKALDQMIFRLLSLKELPWKWWVGIIYLPYLTKKKFAYPQKREGEFKKAVQVHYDRELEIYQDMLDPSLIYSCGYWKEADSLEEAQLNKVKLIARKLQLRPGMRVLDIGCGFGFLPYYLARTYDVEVCGVTLSSLQYSYASKRYQNEEGVYFLLENYQNLKGDEYFNRIVSVGMFEHVHWRYYDVFMEKVAQLLRRDGLFLLHTIGGNNSHIATDPWIDKYIFPGGVIPSYEQIISSAKKHFILEDWQNFGFDYDKTLMAWWKNFSLNFSKKKKNLENNKFYRMWKFYLLSCAGAFRARHLHLWQIVFAKRERRKTYYSVR